MIPHSEFHTGTWLHPVEGAGWYYFMKKRSSNTITSKRFITSVDGPLKELVRFLHKKKIKTTPSCSGHHISERNLEKIYEGLLKDSLKIRDGGLALKDVQTGRVYCFKNKTYVLPWNEHCFLEKLVEYQQKGVIGLRFGNRKLAKKELLKIKIEGVRIYERDSIVFIFTNGDQQGNNRSTWKEITKAVKKILA